MTPAPCPGCSWGLAEGANAALSVSCWDCGHFWGWEAGQEQQSRSPGGSLRLSHHLGLHMETSSSLHAPPVQAPPCPQTPGFCSRLPTPACCAARHFYSLCLVSPSAPDLGRELPAPRDTDTAPSTAWLRSAVDSPSAEETGARGNLGKQWPGWDLVKTPQRQS